MVNGILLGLLSVLSTATWVLAIDSTHWSPLYLLMGFLLTHGLILAYLVLDERWRAPHVRDAQPMKEVSTHAVAASSVHVVLPLQRCRCGGVVGAPRLRE